MLSTMMADSRTGGLKTREWRRLAASERVGYLRRLRKIIKNRVFEIAGVVSAECMRDVTESISQEVFSALEVIRYLEKSMPGWLEESRPYFRPGFIRKRNTVLREPLGNVALLTPYNFPFCLAVMGLAFLLLSGNCVALKPSEKAPKTASLLEELLVEAGIAPDYCCLVLGDRRVGEELIAREDIKKVVFFGSRRAGRAVEENCREHGKSAILELGGGTNGLVLNDAPLKLAARGLSWSGFYSNGRSCIATERIFVDERVIGLLLELMRAGIRSVPVHPCFSRLETERIRALLDDALNRGGELVCGGRITERSSGLFSIEPTIVLAQDIGSLLYHEEIFAPLIAICAVRDSDDAIAKMGECYQPLGTSIWTRNRKKAFDIAARVMTGMVWINDASFGLPNLPWHGWNESGGGTFLSRDALDEVTRLKWVSHHPGNLTGKRIWWYPYSPWKKRFFAFLAKWFY
jgi:acyl-CoA reductase-like NAD-dependent aldehyde dehydrogenase